ncbi:unnamed protein product, partial [Scytosiphon promiscuus]
RSFVLGSVGRRLCRIPSTADSLQITGYPGPFFFFCSCQVQQHLHRLGRAARAGRTGKATNFYDASTKDLVNSITEAGEGSRLDGSFSRQRGFRKKFKKYGPSRTFP